MIAAHLQTGKVKNPPVLFLHGFMGSSADWLPLAESLSSDYFCLLPDLPGHGQNINLPRTTLLNFDAVTAALFEFLQQRNSRPVNLVGYSMGGRLALYFALRYPQVVSSLVLEGANPGLPTDDARRTRAVLDDQRAEQLLQIGVPAFVEQWYQLALFASLQNQPHLLAKTKERRSQNDARWLAKVIRELSPGRQPSLWADLPRLSARVLLLVGTLDSKYVALAQQMAAQIPRAEVQLVPQAGHNVHLEQPQQFTRLLRDFLAR
jgi:2-succinyl-6-hydroxy-2,4-cyclohexadiene-1-carboxylate synthase